MQSLQTVIFPWGGLLDSWNGGVNVLIWGLQFWGGEIIWGLKFRGPKCVICGLKFGVGEIIWGLIFLTCHCPGQLSGIKPFLNWTAVGVFEKVVLII